MLSRRRLIPKKTGQGQGKSAPAIVAYRFGSGLGECFSDPFTFRNQSTDPTIQLLENRSNPLAVTPILLKGATGTNLATGQANQPTTQNDPDSLKLTPTGDLMLTSGDDGQLIFVEKPGKRDQSVSFLQLLDPSTGLAVSGLDDAVFAGEGRDLLSD